MIKLDILKKEQYIRSFAVLVILLFIGLIIFSVENLLISIMLAFVINYLLAPIVNWVERTGLSRKITVAALFTLITVLFWLGIYLLFPSFTAQLISFKNELPKYMEGMSNMIENMEQRLNTSVFSFSPMDMSHKMNSVIPLISAYMLEGLPNLISSSLSVLILAPFFAFFMLLDGHSAIKKLLSLVPNNMFELALNLQYQMNTQLGDFIRARLFEAGIVGLVVWIGLSMTGFPYAALLGIFAGLMNLIPYIGPVFGAIPAVLIALVNGVPGLTFIMVTLVYLVAQLIDTLVIIPVVVAKIVDLHPVFVVIIIIIGAQVSGIIGMIISIPVACMLKLVIKTLFDHLIKFQT